MSFRAIRWVNSLRDGEVSGLTIAGKAVLVVLADHADKRTEIAFPSVSTIAAAAFIGQRSVPRILTRLLALGLIEMDGKRAGGAKSTRYRICVPMAFDRHVTPDLVAGVTPDSVAGVTPELVAGVTPDLVAGVTPT